jgi:hypothetical protein
MTRRAFLGVAMFLVAASNLLMTACTTSVQQIENWVAVGINALASVVNILEGAGIPIPGGGAIDLAIKAAQTAFNLIKAAIDKYNAAPADQKKGLLSEIATAIASAEGSIQSFWNSLSLPDAKLASLVEGLLGVIVSTLAGFAATLPPVQRAAIAGGRRLAVRPVKRDKKKFAKDFNSLLVGTTYSQYAITSQ